MKQTIYARALSLTALSMFLVGCSSSQAEDPDTDQQVIEKDFNVDFENNDDFEESDEDFSGERKDAEPDSDDADVEAPEDE